MFYYSTKYPGGAINSFEGIQKVSQSWHLNWILKDEWTFASWRGKKCNELREMFWKYQGSSKWHGNFNKHFQLQLNACWVEGGS